MTFGKPRYDNKWIIYKQLSTNRCGGYFFYSLRILIVHVFALDHLEKIIKQKTFLKTLGWSLIVHMKESYQRQTLNHYITISFTDTKLSAQILLAYKELFNASNYLNNILVYRMISFTGSQGVILNQIEFIFKNIKIYRSNLNFRSISK